MARQFFFSLLFLFSFSCFGQAKISLSLEESAVLEQFFQVLVEQSEAGYVFYDKKPVCIHAFFHHDPFMVESSLHKHSVALREGARIWNKFAKKKSDLIVHICDKKDPNIPKFIHVLVINRPLFYRVVEKNLSLFQYVLGPLVTPHDLLDAMLASDQTYYSLLRGDKALIGEILGFGTQNSLFGSRLENIQEAAEEEVPPFLNNRLLVSCGPQEYLPLQPSFGFVSTEQELSKLEERIEISSEKLIQKNPQFIFGRLKDSNEATALVSELEDMQDEIQEILKSPAFLEQTLEKLSDIKYEIPVERGFRFQFDKEEINRVVARGLWESIQDHDFEYLSYFIDGIEEREIQQTKVDRLAWFPEYRREFLTGKKNLERSNTLFQSFSDERDFHCVVQQKLYYKILEKGNGETCNSPLISLNYSLFSPLGQCLASQKNVSINLKNTISGFVHGIKGMKIGETREIFIHPSLAYGFNTSLEKCIYLKAIVTLRDIQENNDSIPEVNCQDLSFLSDTKTMKMRNENYRAALIEKGRCIARHLRKCPEIDLCLIGEYLRLFYNSNESFAPTTQAEQNLINQVHWNIYRKEA